MSNILTLNNIVCLTEFMAKGNGSKDSNSPHISVIIPTLNEEKYLPRCLNSLSEQRTDLIYEIIVADSDSTDGTIDIAKEFGNKVVIEHKRTISAGRNAAIRASEGDIIMSTDADTVFPPHWIERIAKRFKDPHVAMVYGPAMPNPSESNFIENAFAEFLKWLAYALFLIGIDFVAGSNLTIRKSTYDKIGGFNPELVTGEDTDLVRKAHKTGKVVYEPNAPVYVSMRRVQKWGYVKYITFHTMNFIRTYLLNKSYEKYEPVR